MQKIENDPFYREERCRLVALAQAETVEKYNRWDNIRLLAVKESARQNHDWILVGQKDSETIDEVIDVASSMGVTLDERDISSAHRLPGGKTGECSIIVLFARRVKKTEMLRNKKKLSSNVRIFEDMSPARAKFFSMMKKDQRIESVWTREATIFYVWRENKRVYKIIELYEAERNLNYEFLEFSKCFNHSRSNIFPSSSCIECT